MFLGAVLPNFNSILHKNHNFEFRILNFEFIFLTFANPYYGEKENKLK